MHELFSTLDAEMLSSTPVRYETSKQIRETLGLQPFEPSMIMAPRFPDQYREEWVALWKEGYKLPEVPEKDRQVYEEMMRIFREMEEECARLNAEAATTSTVAAEEPDDDDGDD